MLGSVLINSENPNDLIIAKFEDYGLSKSNLKLSLNYLSVEDALGIIVLNATYTRTSHR